MIRGVWGLKCFVVLSAVPLAAKLVAATWGLGNQLRTGSACSRRLRENPDDAELATRTVAAFVFESNPIDRRLYRSPGDQTRPSLLLLFRAPVTISAAAVAALWADGLAQADDRLLDGWLAVAVLLVGIAAALSATVHLVTAVVRRLILGHHDSAAVDVHPPRFRWARDWAMSVDSGARLPLYFLGLLSLSVLGFVGLYAALDATVADAFTRSGVTESPANWVYLSLTTVSTVGFGDVHAQRAGAQLAVAWQIGTGPVLLSWLLAVFLSSQQGPAR